MSKTKRNTRTPSKGPSVQLVDIDVTDEDEDEEEGEDSPPDSPPAEQESAPPAPRRKAQSKSDCAMCQYGKPALAGAVAGALLAYLGGGDFSRGALYGIGAGLLFGAVRG